MNTTCLLTRDPYRPPFPARRPLVCRRSRLRPVNMRAFRKAGGLRPCRPGEMQAVTGSEGGSSRASQMLGKAGPSMDRSPPRPSAEPRPICWRHGSAGPAIWQHRGRQAALAGSEAGGAFPQRALQPAAGELDRGLRGPGRCQGHWGRAAGWVPGAHWGATQGPSHSGRERLNTRLSPKPRGSPSGPACPGASAGGEGSPAP